MPSFTLRPLLVALAPFIVVAGSAIGCRASANYEPGPLGPEPSPTPSAHFSPPPAPPPPRCEELLEGCLASASTRISIGAPATSFAAPEGWLYAVGSSGGVAQNPAGTALIALTRSSNPPATVEESVEQLALRYGVKGFAPQDFKPRLKTPQQTLSADSGRVDLWEVEKSGDQPVTLRDKGPGTLLVLRAKPSADSLIVGIGFVVEAAAEVEAPRVMRAVQSLRSVK